MNSRSFSWQASRSILGATPALWASTHRIAQRHHLYPGESPGNPYIGAGFVRSSLFGKGQEFCSDLCADDVPAVILGTSAAEAIAVEASHGRGAAELQGSAQDI